jgi:hypothetical protein
MRFAHVGPCGNDHLERRHSRTVRFEPDIPHRHSLVSITWVS